MKNKKDTWWQKAKGVPKTMNKKELVQMLLKVDDEMMRLINTLEAQKSFILKSRFGLDKVISNIESSNSQIIGELSEQKCMLNRLVEKEKEINHRLMQSALNLIGQFSPEKQMEFYERWNNEIHKEIPEVLRW